jgi:methionyl-tRNA formyltransferase
VVTRPDRPQGRGRRVASPPVASEARSLSLPVAQPARVNDEDARELIAAQRPQAVVVCAFGALIKEPLLSAHEMLNVHPSLLPRWRGAAPIERALMEGDSETGVSIMRLTAGLDSGPLCLSRAVPIAADDDYGALAGRLQDVGGSAIVSVLDQLERGEPLEWAEQDEALATYAAKIEPDDRLLDPRRPALELERVVRALHPHVGARVALPDGAMLGVLRAALSDAEIAGELPAAAGVLARDGRLLLSCQEGALELLEVKPAGGKPMDASAFLRGHGVPSG